MEKLRAVAAVSMAIISIYSLGAAEEPPPSCKPVEHYRVKGCALLPDQTCPPGYHKQAVSPPDPRMMGPTYLMCVADKPPAKEEGPKSPPRDEARKSPR